MRRELRHGELRTLRQDVIPEMTQALKLTEYAYQRGRYSYLEWVEAQRALLTAELDVIAASVRYHTLAAEIERLIGAALPAANL